MNKRRILGLKKWAGLTLLLCHIATVSCRSHATPEKWIISENYRGWLRVDYAVDGEPPLPLDKGAYVVSIPPSGRLKTSTLFDSSIDETQFFELTARGPRPLAISRWDAARNEGDHAEYGVQKQIGQGGWDAKTHKLRDSRICVFVGTHAEDRANFQDCLDWKADQPMPPDSKRHILLPEHPRTPK